MRFLPDIDDTFSTGEKLNLLAMASNKLIEDIERNGPEAPDTWEEDVAVMRKLACDASPDVRAAAVNILAERGPVTWDDAEQWMFDPARKVREAAFFAMGFSTTGIGALCTSDGARFAALLVSSVRRYKKFPVSATRLAFLDEEWKDLMWDHIGHLLDQGDEKLTLDIQCGILEDILRDQLIGVDDPRLQDWINGDSFERKQALLAVVNWFGCKEPWQRQIAEGLANDENDEISSTARCLLARGIENQST